MNKMQRGFARKKFDKFSAGFTLVETLLVILIASVIGFGGYWVWHTQIETKPTITSKNTTTTTRTPSPVDPTANWLLYKDPGGIYTVRVADGWTLDALQDSPTGSANLIAYVRANIHYEKGKLATITSAIAGGHGGPVAFSLVGGNKDIWGASLPKGDKQSKFLTDQGLDVDKYIYVQTTSPEGPELLKGSKEYTYVVAKGNIAVRVMHDESPGDPDNVSTIEQVVKTIEL